MAGSHNTRRKKPEGEKGCIYWRPLEHEEVLLLLSLLCNEEHSVIVFGEIYGVGIQDLDYGTQDGYRVFDISVDGKYLDWATVKSYCDGCGVPTVPLLYEGRIQQGIGEAIHLWPHDPGPAGSDQEQVQGPRRLRDNTTGRTVLRPNGRKIDPQEHFGRLPRSERRQDNE